MASTTPASSESAPASALPRDRHNVTIPSQRLTIRPRRIDLAPFDPADESSGAAPASSVLAYLGIPYAEPPTGDLRWRVPQRPRPRPKEESRVRDSRWQPDAPQPLRDQLSLSKGRTGHKTSVGQSEADCLTLNIWVPQQASDDGAPLPVAVWIHGGACVTGSASMPIHDGARLASEQGIVVVSVQYRLGALGFLTSRELSSGSGDGDGDDSLGPDPYFASELSRARADGRGNPSGNWGFWDAAASLQWIQEHIARFNGDPARVTVFGESAGGILIHYLMLCPYLPGNLFARAILQSGTSTAIPPRSRASAQAMFDYLVESLGAKGEPAGDDPRRADLLRSAELKDILGALSKLPPIRRPRKEYTPGGSTDRPLFRPPDAELHFSGGVHKLDPFLAWGPTWDGVLVPHDFKSLVSRGFSSANGNGCAGVMLGWTVDEGSMFNLSLSSPDALRKHMATCHPSQQPRLRELYGVDAMRTDSEAASIASAFTGDAVITSGVLATARALAASSGAGIAHAPPTRLYLFGLRPALSHLQASTPLPDLIADLLGVLHTAEIPYVFGFDGTEPHTYAQGEDYGCDVDAPLKYAERKSTALSPAGLPLAKRIMRDWGRFVRGEDSEAELWPAAQLRDASATAGPEDASSAWNAFAQLPVMAYGDAAQLGDARGQTSDKAELTRVGETAFWASKVAPHAKSVQERMAFWTDQKSWSTEYYGDPHYQESV